jgi:hypothetical protein
LNMHDTLSQLTYLVIFDIYHSYLGKKVLINIMTLNIPVWWNRNYVDKFQFINVSHNSTWLVRRGIASDPPLVRHRSKNITIH